MIMTSKKCTYCGKAFEANNPRKIYCCDACKQRNYEEKHGKPTPAFALSKNFELISQEINIKVPNPEYVELLAKINQDNSNLRCKEFSIEKSQAEIDRLKSVLEKQLVAKATNLTSIQPAKNVQPWLKTLEEVAKIIITVQNSGKMLKENQSAEISIKQHQQSIIFIKAEIFNITQQILAKTELLEQIPKELDEKRIVERKVAIETKKLVHHPEIMSASQLVDMKFDLYELDGNIVQFLGNISKNVFVTAYGMPGSGKSTFFVQLAVYFTRFGNVFYVTPEEGLGSTFQNKLKGITADLDNLYIAAFNTLDQITKVLKKSNYKFCFIDSINLIKDATPEAFDKFRKQCPTIAFFMIMQSNKDGKYKGSSEYSHSSDINIEVVDGVATTIKTRFNKSCSYKVFENC